MRFAFTEDQLMLRDTVRDVLTRECQPEVVRAVWENGSGVAQSVWSTLAETGVVGMLTSEDAGGMGMGELETTLPLEEAGYAALPSSIVETTAVGIPLLESIGTDAQKDRWLGAAAAGEFTIALGFEDQKLIANAPIADVFLLQRNGVMYCVPKAELSMVEEVSVDRARRVATVEYVANAEHSMLADEGSHICRAFDRAVLATSAQLVGLSRRMLDMTVQYAKDREQFGKPIGAQQAVKHRLANALIKQEFAKPVVYRAAWSLSTDQNDCSVQASMAKIYSAEAARFVAKQALQVHGAIGYTIECDLHMWMKRVWALSAAYGDVPTHRRRVAAAILD